MTQSLKDCTEMLLFDQTEIPTLCEWVNCLKVTDYMSCKTRLHSWTIFLYWLYLYVTVAYK